MSRALMLQKISAEILSIKAQLSISDILSELADISKKNTELTQQAEDMEDFFGVKLGTSAMETASKEYQTSKQVHEQATKIVQQIQFNIKQIASISPKVAEQLEKALKVAVKEQTIAQKNLSKLEKAYRMVAQQTMPAQVIQLMQFMLDGFKSSKAFVSVPSIKEATYGYVDQSYVLEVPLAENVSVKVDKGLTRYGESLTFIVIKNSTGKTPFRDTEKQKALDTMIAELKQSGSPLLKENVGISTLRLAEIQQVKQILQKFISTKGRDYDTVEYRESNKTLVGSVRTSIRQEDYGEYSDEADIRADAYLLKPFKALVSNFKTINNIYIGYGEKGWWTFYIQFKG